MPDPPAGPPWPLPFESPGLLIALLGAVLLVIGLLVHLGAFSWFGRLPGDIRLDRDGLRVRIPITSMLVLSAAASLLLHFLRKLL